MFDAVKQVSCRYSCLGTVFYFFLTFLSLLGNFTAFSPTTLNKIWTFCQYVNNTNLVLKSALKIDFISIHTSICAPKLPWSYPLNKSNIYRIKKVLFLFIYYSFIRLPQWLGNKESTCEAQATGDAGSIPRSGRCTGGEHGNPFLYSCLGNPMDRGAWRAQVHGVANVIVLLCLCEMILPISSREKKEIPQ